MWGLGRGEKREEQGKGKEVGEEVEVEESGQERGGMKKQEVDIWVLSYKSDRTGLNPGAHPLSPCCPPRI